MPTGAPALTDPDLWLQQQNQPALTDPDEWLKQQDLAGAIQAGEQIKKGAPYRFAQRVVENLNPAPLLQAAAHPIDTAKAMITESGRKANEAIDAAKQGRLGRAVLSAAEAVPLAGPMVSQAEQDIQQGNLAGMAGTGASLVLPALAGRVNPKIGLSSNLNPVERSAVAAGEAANVPIDLATATGNRAVRGAQEILANQPFTASRIAKLRLRGDQGMEQWGRGIAGQIAPQPLTPADAGEQVTNALQRRIGKLDTAADASYQKVRAAAKQPQNIKSVQVGTTQAPGANPAASLTPAGMPVSVPKMEDLALPTDYTAIRTQIQPILEQLEKTIPEAQKQSSPGLAVLRQVATRPDAVDINTALSDLSAIQNIARLRNELPAVRGASKGLAASVAPPLRSAIDAAAQAGGPDVLKALNQGRLATKSKYAVNDVLKSLPDEPAQVYNRLTSSGDRAADLLSDVQAKAPNTLPSVARTFVEGLVDNMTYQGDLRRAQSAVRAWHAMGDRTKNILFPDPAIRQNVTDFVNLAEMMTRRVNPSGTGATLTSVLGLMKPWTLAAQIVAGTPVTDLLMGGKGPAIARTRIPLTPGPKAVGAVVGSNVGLPNQQQEIPRFAKGGIISSVFPLKHLAQFARLNGLSEAATRDHLQSEGFSIK